MERQQGFTVGGMNVICYNTKRDIEADLLTQCIKFAQRLELQASAGFEAGVYSLEALESVRGVLSSLRRCKDFFHGEGDRFRIHQRPENTNLLNAPGQSLRRRGQQP
jgi:hypothetical protein